MTKTNFNTGNEMSLCALKDLLISPAMHSLGFVSAWTDNKKSSDNLKRDKILKDRLKSFGLSYFELSGRWLYPDGTPAVAERERKVFCVVESKEDGESWYRYAYEFSATIIQLGRSMEQDAVVVQALGEPAFRYSEVRDKCFLGQIDSIEKVEEAIVCAYSRWKDYSFCIDEVGSLQRLEGLRGYTSFQGRGSIRDQVLRGAYGDKYKKFNSLPEYSVDYEAYGAWKRLMRELRDRDNSEAPSNRGEH